MVDVPLATAPSGVDEDAWLAACSAVRSYCGWHVAPSVTETLTRDGSGQVFQSVPSLYVTDVASVTEDGTLLESSTYEWSEIGQLWRAYPWTGHFRAVDVELTHGYDECPPEILGVLAEMAAAVGRGGVSQVTSGSHQVSFEVAPSSQQRAILDSYRLAKRP